MTSQKERVMKGWREYLKRIFIWIFHYSGAKFIYRKFNPYKDSGSLPTGVIWLIGIYVAFFGVASQRYENRIDIIENRVNSIFSQLATDVYKKALSRISTVQNMSCPEKPEILNPPSVFRSLFKESEYQEIVNLLKETVENWKKNLDNVHLMEAKLEGAELEEANLQRALLWRANLQKANIRRSNLQGAILHEANLKRSLAL